MVKLSVKIVRAHRRRSEYTEGLKSYCKDLPGSAKLIMLTQILLTQIWVDIVQYGALLFRFSRNSCDRSISDSIAWNRSKFCMLYINFERWHWYKLCECSLLGGTVVTIFPEFSWKCRFCILLDGITHWFIYQIHISRNNNYTF